MLKKVALVFALTLSLAGAGPLLAQGEHDPAGKPPQAPPRGGPPRGPSLDQEKPPMAADDAEAEILAVLDDLFKNQRQGMMNVPPEDGRLLRLLTEAVGAKNVVEIGASNGYSGLWFCLALRATGGRLTTHEIDARRAALARENFSRAGVSDLVTLVEGDAHKEIGKLKDPIDIIFLDADKAGYYDYLNKLLPLLRPGGLILAHNTREQSGAMKDYIRDVTSDPQLDTVFMQKHAKGIGVTLKKRLVK